MTTKGPIRAPIWQARSQTHAALLPLAPTPAPLSKLISIPTSTCSTTFEMIEHVQHSSTASNSWPGSQWPADLSSPSEIDSIGGDCEVKDWCGVRPMSPTGSDNSPTPEAGQSETSEVSEVSPDADPEGSESDSGSHMSSLSDECSEDDDDFALFEAPTVTRKAKPNLNRVSSLASLKSAKPQKSFRSTTDAPAPVGAFQSPRLEVKEKSRSSLLNSALANAHVHLKDNDSASIRPPRSSASVSKHNYSSGRAKANARIKDIDSANIRRPSTALSKSSKTSSSSSSSSPPKLTKSHPQKLFKHSRVKSSDTSSVCTDNASLSLRHNYLAYFHPSANEISTAFPSRDLTLGTFEPGIFDDSMTSSSTIEVNIHREELQSFKVGDDTKFRAAPTLRPQPQSLSVPELQVRVQRRTSTPFGDYIDYEDEKPPPVPVLPANLVVPRKMHLSKVEKARDEESIDSYDSNIIIVHCDEDKDINTNVAMRLAISLLRDLREDPHLFAARRSH